MKQYLIAHDLGTSGNKATLYTVSGELVGSCIATYDTHTQHSGWAEQSPEAWWQAVCNSTKQLMARKDPRSVAGISFSGQMMGCVCLDKAGRCLGNSIIWADTRAQTECDALTDTIGTKEICRITGMRPAPNYTLEKLMWLKVNRQDIYSAIACVLQSKDYMIYRMTGERVTDRTDASCTQAYDIRTNEWSDKLLYAAGLDRNIFPSVVLSTQIVGTLLKSPAEEMGLAPGIPIVAGAGDGLCATVGAGSVLPGNGYCCIGSSSWVSSSTDSVFDNTDGTLMYGPHIVNGRYNLTGTMQTCSLAYNWAKQQLMPGASFDDINAEIEKVPIGCRGTLFLPYLMGERAPWWNSSLRGSYLGLGLDTTPCEMMRAVVEGVCMNLKLIFDEINRYETVCELNIIGGGAKANIWRQTLADIFGVPIHKLVASDEGSSFGAIVIAGVGLGLFDDVSVVNSLIKRDCTNNPNPIAHRRYSELLIAFREACHATEPFYSSNSR